MLGFNRRSRFSAWSVTAGFPGIALHWKAEYAPQIDTLQPRRRNFPRELRRDDLTPVGPAVQNGLHLGCVPGHDDVGQQTQGVSHRLHFLGPLGLSRAHSAGINRPLQGIDRLTPVEYPTQLIPEGVFDKVVGQERSSQQAPQLNTRFVDGVSPRRRSKSGQRCNCAGVATHHR